MKTKWSKRFEFDLKNLKQITVSILIWVMSIYSANTEIFNTLLAKYIVAKSS